MILLGCFQLLSPRSAQYHQPTAETVGKRADFRFLAVGNEAERFGLVSTLISALSGARQTWRGRKQVDGSAQRNE